MVQPLSINYIGQGKGDLYLPVMINEGRAKGTYRANVGPLKYTRAWPRAKSRKLAKIDQCKEGKGADPARSTTQGICGIL